MTEYHPCHESKNDAPQWHLNDDDKPFDELAEAIGKGTVAWYAERNLARTEEPTLWAGKDKPKLLAPASEESALASAKQPEDGEKSPKPDGKASMPEPMPRDLPAV